MRLCRIISLLSLAIAGPLAISCTSAQQPASQTETEASSTHKTREQLLRDPSDVGIGLSFDRYRDYVPRKDLQQRRRGLAELGLGPARWYQPGSAAYGLYPYQYRYGDPLGYQPFGRSPIYDWKAPEVRQIGNHWDIRPGYFRQSNVGGLWRP